MSTELTEVPLEVRNKIQGIGILHIVAGGLNLMLAQCMQQRIGELAIAQLQRRHIHRHRYRPLAVGFPARDLRNHLMSQRDPDSYWEVERLYRGI